MEKKRLNEIAGRLKLASKGPWGGLVKEDRLFLYRTDESGALRELNSMEDAVFLSYARVDIPLLLDEVGRLQKELRETSKLRGNPVEEYRE